MVSYKIGNYKKYLLKTLFFHAEVMEHTTKNGPRKRRSLSGPTFFVLDTRGLQKIKFLIIYKSSSKRDHL